MNRTKQAGCTAAELATLGEAFNILATKSLCMAELLLRTDAQHDTEAAEALDSLLTLGRVGAVSCADTEAAEALARQMCAIADTAAEWCGAGICVGGLRGSFIAGACLPEKLLHLARKQEGGAA